MLKEQIDFFWKPGSDHIVKKTIHHGYDSFIPHPVSCCDNCLWN